MGTLFEALLVGEDEEHLAAVADAVLDEVPRIERLLSRFDPQSEICRINRMAGRESVLVDREVADLLAVCLDAYERTGGSFDISTKCVPLAPRVANAGLLGDSCHTMPAIHFDHVQRMVRFAIPSLSLDLGGIGKGYALDRAAAILAENGVGDALLHGGTSSVLARGYNPFRQPWTIDLPTGMPVSLSDAALSCSAVNEQEDIIDPHTGKPIVEPAACAVIAKSATEAEIWSTAALILGRELAEREVAGAGLQLFWLGSDTDVDSGS